MESFYRRLSYSIGNEDWRTEQRALQLDASSRALVITASGDRPLNLLSGPCKEIVALDINPWQNALLDLKRVALNRLDYRSYLGFLGIEPMRGRGALYKQIRGELQPQHAALWDRRLGTIERGVIYRGVTERWMQVMAHCIRLWRGKAIDALFACGDLEEQRELVLSQLATPRVERAVRFLVPFFNRYFLRDPGLKVENVDGSIHSGQQIFDDLKSALLRFSPRESIVLSVLLQGRIFKEAYPPYLTESGVSCVRRGLPALSIRQGDLLDYLEAAPAGSFDRFSLSDVASFLSREQFDRLCRALRRVAAPGARFCIRQFCSKHRISDEMAPFFKREEALEKSLQEEDRCFLYRFVVGTILK